MLVNFCSLLVTPYFCSLLITFCLLLVIFLLVEGYFLLVAGYKLLLASYFLLVLPVSFCLLLIAHYFWLPACYLCRVSSRSYFIPDVTQGNEDVRSVQDCILLFLLV